jgi:predicted lipoprotein with Yx(FWY)xxD motif
MPKIFGPTPLAVAAVLAIASSAFAAGPPSVGATAKGNALVDSRGMTLYTFDKDSGGNSACNGNCAVNWPPLRAGGGAAAPAGYTAIHRADGTEQWAYKGKPLYGWVKDKKPGDVTGDGFNNVWHIARP